MYLSIFRQTHEVTDITTKKDIYRSYELMEVGVIHRDDKEKSQVSRFFHQNLNKECNINILVGQILFERNPDAPYSIELEKAYFESIRFLLEMAIRLNFEPIQNADQKNSLYKITKCEYETKSYSVQDMRLFKATLIVDKVNESTKSFCMKMERQIGEEETVSLKT